MDARDILIRPMITEHTTDLMAEGKYVFIVDKNANKIQIANAVTEIFQVKVEKVNTSRTYRRQAQRFQKSYCQTC